MPESGLLGYPGNGAPVDLDPNTQLFTSSGVWTKPADAQWVRVILCGGGGGGGGGARAGAGSGDTILGGNGGGGGGISFIDIPASLLPSTVPVTIGAGGIGGSGGTSGSAATAGSAGGTSTFGDILSAEGGAASSGNPPYGGRGHISGGEGTTTSNINTPGRRFQGTPGGGCGGSIWPNSANYGLPLFSQTTGLPFSEPQKFGVVAVPGSGGAPNLFGTEAFSATPGILGSGGAGGGAGRNFNGGNGSNGGDGYCMVVSYGTRYRPINVQEFRTGGTWVKPSDPRLTQAKVFAIGGGGGGGSGSRWNSSNGAYLTGSSLALSGIAGCNASTPDSAALSITGDIDIQVKMSTPTWCEGTRLYGTAGVFRTIVAKNGSGSTFSYMLRVNGSGYLSLVTSNNGSTQLTAFSDINVTFTRNSIKWVRATMDANDGAGNRVYKFYTSDDGSSWTQLGNTITTAGATTIFDSTSTLWFGSETAGSTNNNPLQLYRVIIRDGYDGAGTTQLDARFENATAGATSFTESSANAATITINNVATTVGGGGGGSGGGVSYAELPLQLLPQQVDVTVGLGGPGGAAVTTDYAFGNNGTIGGNTTFGSIVVAPGGEQGYGGVSAVFVNTLSARYDWNNVSMATSNVTLGTLSGGGGGGAGGANSAGSTAVQDRTGACFMTSGGGGGAGIGSAGQTYGGAIATKSFGYGVIQSDTAAGQNGVDVFQSATGMFGSVGGGGGSSNGAVNGGNGGRGSGGGGGAATTTGTNSGSGGNGGDGYLLVICT